MSDLSQANFDRAEEIADALHAITGLDDALQAALGPVFAATTPAQECTINALVDAMASFRSKAIGLAADIAHSGAERGKLQ